MMTGDVVGWQGLLRLDAKALGISPSDPRFDKHFAVDVSLCISLFSEGLRPPRLLSVLQPLCVVRPLDPLSLSPSLDPLSLPPTHPLTLTLTYLPTNEIVSPPDCLGSVAAVLRPKPS